VQGSPWNRTAALADAACGGRSRNCHDPQAGGGGGGDQPHHAPGFRNGSKRGRRKDEQTDSRFDPRYDSGFVYEGGNNGANGGAAGGGDRGLPIPSFAPLPSYAGADDLSSVGGDSAYDGSQYGGSRASFWSQRKENNPGPSLGYFVGAPGGNYYSTNDMRSQADNGSIAGTIDSRRF